MEFEKNVDCFVLEPHVQTLEDLGWEYLDEKLTIDLTDDLRAAIDPAPFGRRALEEDRKPSIKERLEEAKKESVERKPPDKAHQKKPPEHDL